MQSDEALAEALKLKALAGACVLCVLAVGAFVVMPGRDADLWMADPAADASAGTHGLGSGAGSEAGSAAGSGLEPGGNGVGTEGNPPQAGAAQKPASGTRPERIEASFAVRDRDSRPMPGATVYVMEPMHVQVMFTGGLLAWKDVVDPEGTWEFSGESLCAKGISGPDGKVRISLPAGVPERASACVYHPDYLPVFLARIGAKAREAGGELDVDVPMREGLCLSGHVRSGSGAAVPGAFVGLQMLDEKDWPFRPRRPGHVKCARTGQDGRYRISGLADGRYTVAAWSATLPPEEEEVVLDGKDEIRSLDFRLLEGEDLEVLVVDTRSRLPWPGAQVRLRKAGEPGEGSGIENPILDSKLADSEGRVVFEGLKPGRYLATAVPPDRAKETNRTPPSFSTSAVFETGMGGELEIEPIVPFDGTVVDAGSGMPVASFRASLSPEWQEDPPCEASNNRDDLFRQDSKDGRFSFEDARPGPWRLEICANGFHPVSMPMSLPASGPAESVRIELRPGKERISGAVLDDSDSKPVPGVKVALYEWFSSGWGNWTESLTDANGAYSLEGALGAGDARWISFEKAGYVPLRIEMDASIAMPAAAPTARLVKPGEIRGVVRDASGLAVSGSRVLARKANEMPKAAHVGLTGPDGSFAIPNLEPGMYKVSGIEGLVAVEPGRATEIEIVRKP